MLQVVLLGLLAWQVASEVDLTVVTSKGPIKGQRATDGDYTTFFGIPYAKVDEDFPFVAYQDYPAFQTPFEASDSSISCPQKHNKPNAQVEAKYDLDCLRLNIFVPKAASKTNPVPVLVWFHGGGFSFGSGGEFGGQYLVAHDIIVVTANYRLGPYGFMCLNDPRVPGNQGLKDQIGALKWVKNNIAAFGGKPDDVTISGESAGGASVDLHLYWPYETLFQKAIIESGSSFVDGMFVPPDRKAAAKLTNQLGYQAHSTADALEYLSKANVSSVLEAFVALDLQLRPCQEKLYRGVQNFIIHDPYQLISPRMKHVKILVGYNSQEEIGPFAHASEDYYKNLGPYFYNMLKKYYRLPEQELEKLSRIIQRFYLGSKPISKEVMIEIINFTSDYMMSRQFETSVNKYIRQGAKEVYKYLFCFIGDSELKNITGIGAAHGAEMKYIFNITNINGEDSTLKTEDEVKLKDRMSTMWANFVKYGNPTPEKTELLPVQWVPVTPDSDARPYLNIDVTLEMKDNVFQERISFWELFSNAYWKFSVKVPPNRSDQHFLRVSLPSR